MIKWVVRKKEKILGYVEAMDMASAHKMAVQKYGIGIQLVPEMFNGG